MTTRPARFPLSIAVALAAVAFGGCLFEPKIEDQWTRLDITRPAPDAGPLPDTLSLLEFRGRIVYRAIRTGSLIAEIRISDSIGYGDVNFDSEAPRDAVRRDVERVLAGSRSVGIAGVLATGWDRLIRDIALTIPTPGGLAHGPEGGVYLLFYMGDEIRTEEPDGTESTRFEPMDFEQMEILPMGLELRTEHPADTAAAAAHAPADAGRRLRASGAPLRGSVSVGAGATLPDRRLADYQWNVDPRSAWRADVGVASDGWGGGVQVQRWGTTQSVAAREAGAVGVRLTSMQPRVERRVALTGGTRLAARAGFGALRVAWNPGTVRLSTGGAPVDVRFRPLWTWLASAGLGVSQSISPALAVGLDLERSLYPLDATHRNDGDFVNRREYFGSWSVGGRLTWRGGSF